MFKTLIATVTAALIVSTLAAPAQAGWYNGIGLNGVHLNGSGENGVHLNGGNGNGMGWNGMGWNGTTAGHQGFAIDGIELPAAR